MKRVLITALCIMVLAVAGYARIDNEYVAPIISERTLNGITFYTVGTSTTTTAVYNFFASSVEFKSTDGFAPGTTNFQYTNADALTIDILINTLNKLDVTIPGADGGIVASRPQGCYGGSLTAHFTAVTGTGTSCHGSAAIQTATLDYAQGISYVLPAIDLSPKQQYQIKAACINVTFASTGTCTVVIHSSDTAAGAQLDHETIAVSALDAKLDIPETGECRGTEEAPVCITVYSDAHITAGRMAIWAIKR